MSKIEPRKLMLSPGLKERFYPTADGRIIHDDDFTYDALLRINGDFGDDATRFAYAQEICALLNASSAIADAVAAERERCALLAESISFEQRQSIAHLFDDKRPPPCRVAVAIRAGEKT